MKNDKQKIDFIKDYISSYERKIKISNKNGLFDEAKLFEHFALRVCELYYNKKFENLNFSIRENYPCVDLKSADGDLFIQVSTCENYNSKIYKTLTGIRDSKEEELKSIKNVNFFFLNYTNEKITDRTGKNRIGSIDFNKTNNLVTTADLIKRSLVDDVFLNKLYQMLKDDEESTKSNSSLLLNAIEQSSFDIETISSTIGDNYVIDRANTINTINECKKSIVAIIGDPGCGKSALAKMFCSDKDIVLFKRAEEIATKNNLAEIWGFDLESIAKYIGGKDLYIIIDSLEFVADQSYKMSLIAMLCNFANSHNNVKLLLTCRTYDYQSFTFIQNKYSIFAIKIDSLTDDEYHKVTNDFPFLLKYKSNKTISELLKIPFYLNLVIVYFAKDRNLDKDGSAFRKHIFDKVICCKKRCHISTLIVNIETFC